MNPEQLAQAKQTAHTEGGKARALAQANNIKRGKSAIQSLANSYASTVDDLPNKYRKIIADAYKKGYAGKPL